MRPLRLITLVGCVLKAKLSILAVLLLLGTTPVFADVLPPIATVGGQPKTYTFNPVRKSLPTVGDDADEICQIGNAQAWFGFDISSVPDVEQVISASFKALMVNFTGSLTRRTLWYDPSDSWIAARNDPSSDPGDKVLSEQVGLVTHDDDDWTWVTIDIDISKHNWSNDVADNYITLMLTGPPNGIHACGAVDFRGAVLELVTNAASTPGDIDIDDNGKLLNLGHEELVQANGVDIKVPGYSVPSFVDWNNDKLNDLVIGEGGGYEDGKVRVYLNVGTESAPKFSDYFYAQSNDSDLVCPASGCMGCFPRVEYWDADERKDLLVGQADGTVEIFLNPARQRRDGVNIGTDESPAFDGGTFLQVGRLGSKTNINVGARAAPCLVDWNSDGRNDLVVGAYDGRIHIFINEGTDTEPDFLVETFAQADGSDLVVPGKRASPIVIDLDNDGRKDILTGNTDGQLLFYRNVGTDAEPIFSDYTLIESNGVPIDLPSSPRSRPFLCYWTGDGHFGPIDAYPDVLIGAGDGKVHLYRGLPKIGDMDGDGNVDLEDLTLFAAYWLQKDYEADFTGDGQVDKDDLYGFIEIWLLALEEQSQN
ncbi:MAG: FG-GAP-like repeat-containing protein [Sedimentisphaerales bacterium]